MLGLPVATLTRQGAQSGQITCYEQRTDHVLPTPNLGRLDRVDRHRPRLAEVHASSPESVRVPRVYSGPGAAALCRLPSAVGGKTKRPGGESGTCSRRPRRLSDMTHLVFGETRAIPHMVCSGSRRGASVWPICFSLRTSECGATIGRGVLEIGGRP